MMRLRVLTVVLAVSVAGVGPTAAPATAASPRAALSGDGVRKWNDVALAAIRRNNAGDAQAARLYALVNIAMYDAINGLEPRAERRHEAIVARAPGAHGDPVAAAAGAARDVLAGIYPADAALFDGALAGDLATVEPAPAAAAGREWGGRVAAGVLAARSNDGSTPEETQPGGAGPGVFTAAWSGVQFRALQPFAIQDPGRYLGAGPPPLTSASYAAAFGEVKAAGSAAVDAPAALATYRYWSLGARTSQPAGAWVQVAQAVSSEQALGLRDTTRLFALLTMAMADTVGPTYATKFDHRFWRPATAIPQADTDGNPSTTADPSWAPRAGTSGSSPEHWSGHSSFSAAGARVLAGFFCENDIGFTLVTDSAPGGAARSYSSFSEAAAEAGRSRVVGGLHFEFSNQAGLEAGRSIADEVLARALRPLRPVHTADDSCQLSP